MKIEKQVDLELNVAGVEPIRIRRTIEFELSGREALEALYEWNGPDSLDSLVKAFARLIVGIPEERRHRLTPESRRLIAGFIESSARRFIEAPTENA